MLLDSDDVMECVNGDVSRSKSIQKISQRYIIDVLICLFLCLEKQSKLQDCISFMTYVRQEQPLLAVSLDMCEHESTVLLQIDLDTVIKRQTDALLKSQSVMYEVLHICDTGAVLDFGIYS